MSSTQTEESNTSAYLYYDCNNHIPLSSLFQVFFFLFCLESIWINDVDATKDFNRLLRCLFSDCKTIISSKTFGQFVSWHSPKGLTKVMLSCLICICSNYSEIEKGTLLIWLCLLYDVTVLQSTFEWKYESISSYPWTTLIFVILSENLCPAT